MQITVAGLGYVGLSLACLLSKHNKVKALDINLERVKSVNSGVSPIRDPEISDYLSNKPLSLHAEAPTKEAYASADLIVVATPTNYDDQTNAFDTSSIESTLDLALESNTSAPIVIKSTVPVGYTNEISRRYPSLAILFSPEFLREGSALKDNLYPSRIIVGAAREQDLSTANDFAILLAEGAVRENVPILIISSTEAEAVKLFSNTYLALRVSYFNELDTYAEMKGLNAENIIDGVCLDPRIGDHYNNPSFGYGGYCLPKDSKQLLANYQDVPQNLIKAIVDSNSTRMDFIASQILKRNPKVVGAYKLAMKSGSDNHRQSATVGVLRRLQKAEIKVIVFDPCNNSDPLDGLTQSNSLAEFKRDSDIIIANRYETALADVKDRVYTRDLWNRD